MKDFLGIIAAIGFFVLVVCLLSWGIYAWWLAPCDFIKQYWYLFQVPGRCL